MICLLNIFKKFSFFFSFLCLILLFRSTCIIAIVHRSLESLPKLVLIDFHLISVFCFLSFTFEDLLLPNTPFLNIYYSNSSLFVYVYS